MSMIIASSTDLGDRWDAEFHLFRRRHEAMAKTLSEGISAETVISRLAGLDFEDLKCLEPLSRGDGLSGFDRRKAYRAITQYPHLALAAVLERRDAAIGRHQETILRAENRIGGILALDTPEQAAQEMGVPPCL